MGKAIGIDLGTTNSVVAYKDTAVKIIQTGANNEDLCRSCVALDKSNQFLVGNTVYHGWKRYTPNIVVSVKRLMGTAFSDPMVQKMKSDKRNYPYGIKKPGGGTDEAVSVVLRGREFSPEQISAEIPYHAKPHLPLRLCHLLVENLVLSRSAPKFLNH